MYCWEMAVMVRKLAVVAAASLVSASQQAFLRLILCLAIVWVSLLLQARSPLLFSSFFVALSRCQISDEMM